MAEGIRLEDPPIIVPVIRAGLAAFRNDAASAPGRFNLFDYRGATALAVVLLVSSFLLLLVLNRLEAWAEGRRR